MKSSMTEMLLGLFQDSADSFLLGDIVVEFMNMAFRFFGALALSFGPITFSFLTLFRFGAILMMPKIYRQKNRPADRQQSHCPILQGEVHHRCQDTGRQEHRCGTDNILFP